MKNGFLVVFLSVCLFYGECGDNDFDYETEIATTHLDLLEMDLEDHCSNLSVADRNILMKKPNAYKIKYEALTKFGDFSRNESEKMRTSEYQTMGLRLHSNYNYRWKILERMGDNELNHEDWEMLSKFNVEVQQITQELQIPCNNIPCDKLPCIKNVSDTCYYSRSDVADMLKRSRDANYLRAVWVEAQKHFSARGKNYKQILHLIKKAAEANEYTSPEVYWSKIVEYPEIFLKTKSLWDEIEPLYKKLQEFVRLRLEHVYRLPKNGSLPVYLLGSEHGLDWTEIADIILPHRYLYDEINASFHHYDIQGKKSYEMAAKLVTSLGIKPVNSKFWKASLFNMTCPSHFLIYCGDMYSQVLTCNKTGFKEFLDAHEDVTHASLNAVDYSSFYSKLRVSVIEEAIVQLSTILAVKNMPMNGIIPEEVIMASEEEHHTEMTALLLTALRVIPRLPFYFLADEWRLKELNEPSEDLVKSWWEFREKYQMVKGVTNQEYDFLGDEYMRTNKPYIGKFLGTILQFQILEHFNGNGGEHVNIISKISKDKSFKSLLKQRLNEDWFETLQNDFDIYDVDTSAMLEYFRPLENYLEEAPLMQVTQTLLSRTTTPLPTTTPMPTTFPPTPEEQLKPTLPSKKPEHSSKDKKRVDFPPKSNTAIDDTQNETNYTTKAAWIGASIGVLSLLVIVGIIGHKKWKRKPRTNNRRFDA